MKNILLLFILTATSYLSNAQVLYNNGAAITVATGANVYVAGNTVNGAGSINNSGLLNVKGNFTNNATYTSADGSTFQLNGSVAQTISGTTAINVNNVNVNNTAGITLGTALKANGIVTFMNGNIVAPSAAAALVFTTNATVTGVSDASHVNGYVVKEGTGSFDYPVGDAAKYQRTTINLSANAGGMAVKYNGANAGTGTFTAAGTEPAPLVDYNAKEHWDMSPLSTATGTVTIYWDGFKDTYTNPVLQRKVAHKVGATWQNEGTTGTGTTAAGSVTSNSISTWSPFTLGTIVSVLPVKWLSVTGQKTVQNNTVVNWKVQETNVADYTVEKSSDAIHFRWLTMVNSMGDGAHNYQITDMETVQNNTYYRILQTGRDGKKSYSPVIEISAVQSAVDIYPTLFSEGFTVKLKKATTANIVDAGGRIIKTINLNNGNNYIDAAHWAKGIYMIIFENGFNQRIIKQ